MFGKLINFFKEVKVELTKVSWSTRQELIGASSVVVVATAVLAVFIGLVDIVLSKLLNLLLR
ncbi:MAG: preprotein translocase subunit SecE [Candidatus Omnitrophota bacterium]